MEKKPYAFINDYLKEHVYDVYGSVCDNIKAYAKITRVKMIEAIYGYYQNNPEAFCHMLLEEEWNQVKKNVKSPSRSHDWILRGPQASDHFLITLGLFHHHKVHPELLPLVKQLTFDQTKKETDNLILFFIGLARIHGLIDGHEAHRILTKMNKEITYDDFITFPRRHKRTLIDVDVIDHNGADIIIHRDCQVPLERLHQYQRTYDYQFDDYRMVGKYLINRNDPTSDEIYTRLEKSLEGWHLRDTLSRIWIEAASGMVPDNVGLLKYLIEETNDPDQAAKLTNDFIASLPLWFYLGDPRRVINFDVPEPVKRVYGKYDPCPCGSGMKYKFCCLNERRLLANKAILHEPETRVLYFLIYDLVTFANHEIHMFKETPEDEDFIDSLNQKEFHTLKAYLFTHPEIIDHYMTVHAEEYPDEIIDILDGFKKAKTDDFTAIKFIDQKLLLLASDEKNAYLVSGIISPMSELISHEDLPVPLLTTIIPYNGHIVFAITFTTYPVTLGPNIRKRLFEVMANVTIIETLV